MSKSGVYSVGKKFFSVLSLRATSLLEKGTCCFDDFFFFVCVCVSSVCSRIMFCVFRYYVGLGARASAGAGLLLLAGPHGPEELPIIATSPSHCPSSAPHILTMV